MSSSSWDAPDNETFFDNTLSEDPFASGFQADDETAEDLARMKADQQDNMLAMLGMKPMMDTQPLPMLGSEQFLQSTKRGAMERATYATGCSYMAGIALGGVRGLFVGLRNAPNRRLRIKLNSVLNACGRGARLGNSLGVIGTWHRARSALAHALCSRVRLCRSLQPPRTWVSRHFWITSTLTSMYGCLGRTGLHLSQLRRVLAPSTGPPLGCRLPWRQGLWARSPAQHCLLACRTSGITTGTTCLCCGCSRCSQLWSACACSESNVAACLRVGVRAAAFALRVHACSAIASCLRSPR